MPERFWEKWKQRLLGAWGVLRGHAFAHWYRP
jgi:hypothetical protein